MKKNVTDILDIHTHKQEVDTQGKSIINYPLLADSPLYMPLAENVEVAVGRGSYYSIGIHPWEVRESNVSQQLSFLQQQLQRKQFVAVGEAGLDKLAKAPMELQLAVFKEQVKLSEKLGLPLIIHCVKAMEELLGVKKESRPQQPWIWHGFRGKPQQARQLMENGMYLSFGEHYPEQTVRTIPVDRMFLETDDSPVDIEEVLHRVARTRGTDVEELRQAIRENIQKVFFRR